MSNQSNWNKAAIDEFRANLKYRALAKTNLISGNRNGF
jgi:hypothetical protein